MKPLKHSCQFHAVPAYRISTLRFGENARSQFQPCAKILGCWIAVHHYIVLHLGFVPLIHYPLNCLGRRALGSTQHWWQVWERSVRLQRQRCKECLEWFFWLQELRPSRALAFLRYSPTTKTFFHGLLIMGWHQGIYSHISFRHVPSQVCRLVDL